MREEEKLKIIEELLNDKSVDADAIVNKIRELYGKIDGGIVHTISSSIVEKIKKRYN